MELPSAQTRIDQNATAAQTAAQLCCVIAPVPNNADGVPRLFGNASAVYAQHGYASGVDFTALFTSETNLPMLFAGIPIASPGAVGRFDQSGNTDTSVVTVVAGASGALEEVDGMVRVNRGGTIGTDQIVIDLSLDGGRSWKEGIKLGTASSYTIPYIGQTLSFAAGDLTAGETVLTWHSTGPMWDSAGITLAKTGLEAQYKQTRSWLVVGDASNSTEVGYVKTAANAYETEVERYTIAKVQLRDRLPQAALSQVRSRMTGAPNVTFSEVGAGNDTATRSSGSFVTDGFVNGDTVRITGAVAGAGHNNITGIATVAASALTFAAAGADLDNEGPIAGVSMTAEPTLTFGDGGGGADSLTRNRGSWLDDGFRAGDVLTIADTVSNNGSTYTIVTVTATTITFATGTVTAEVIGSYGVTITAGETDAQFVTTLEAAMSTIADEPRVDLGIGRGFKLSPFIGAELRRPVQWADTLQAYKHDVHVSTWAKKKAGSCSGWSLKNAEGIRVEHDENFDKNALSAGFTCFRSFPNGPDGAFIARSVTRGEVGTVFSATEFMAVINLAQTISQAEAENALGEDLILNIDGTATPEALGIIKSRVDSALLRDLLPGKTGEGARASRAYWTPASDDDLSGVDATLNAVLSIELNGKLVHVNTKIRVNAGS